MFDYVGVIGDAFLFHFHRDKMNAAVLCAPVRYSELTVRLAQASAAVTGGEHSEEAEMVLDTVKGE